MNIDFYEGDRMGFVKRTGCTTIGAVGGNERGESYGARVREEERNLENLPKKRCTSYLMNTRSIQVY